MSAIDPTAPTSSGTIPAGDDAQREERQWLLDLWTAYKVRHNTNGGTPNDPGLSTGEVIVPSAAPGSPKVGDFYLDSSGRWYGYKTGPAAQLMGTFAAGNRVAFKQSAAPTGWTRDTGLTTDSVLTYKATGDPGSGGTQSVTVAYTHTAILLPDILDRALSSGAFDLFQSVNDHSAIRYIDVILATKD